jgi:hypothetical protein
VPSRTDEALSRATTGEEERMEKQKRMVAGKRRTPEVACDSTLVTVSATEPVASHRPGKRVWV